MIVAASLLLTAALLFYVFSPAGRIEVSPEKTRLLYLRERKDAVYENLRDLNFDFKAGKFPEKDYQSLRAALEEEAAALLAEIARLEQTADRVVGGRGIKATEGKK